MSKEDMSDWLEGIKYAETLYDNKKDIVEVWENIKDDSSLSSEFYWGCKDYITHVSNNPDIFNYNKE